MAKLYSYTLEHFFRDFTEEEMDHIKAYAEFVKNRRNRS